MIRPPRKGANISNVELINRLIEQRLCSVHTSIPGKVVAYDATNHAVDVQPLLKEPCFDDQQNRVKSESYPLLPDVPIRYPCGGGYTITFPLAVGDHGMIEVVEADTEALELSGNESEVFDLRRHNLSHATFVPDFWNRTDLIPIVANALVIGRRSSGQQLRIGESNVEACSAAVGSADDFVALAAKVDAFITQITDLLSGGGEPPYWVVVPTDGGGALQLAAKALWTIEGGGSPPDSVASSNLKAD